MHTNGHSDRNQPSQHTNGQEYQGQEMYEREMYEPLGNLVLFNGSVSYEMESMREAARVGMSANLFHEIHGRGHETWEELEDFMDLCGVD